MATPRRYRRHGSSPNATSVAYQNLMVGGSVPLKINFTSSQSQRHTPTRRRSAEYRIDHHVPVHISMPPARRKDDPFRAPPSSPRTTEEVWDLGLQRLKSRDDMHPSSSKVETRPLNPAIMEERPFTPSIFPNPPKVASFPSKSTPEAIGHDSPTLKTEQPFTESPLDHKSKRMDSPLQDAFEPLQTPVKQPAKPTGKRQRLPSAWVSANAAPTSKLDSARVRCKPDNMSSVDLSGTDFQIPRKPPPVPKAAQKPAPLTLFPIMPAKQVSTPVSQRSGSTLVGIELDGEPSTPTTLTSAQKLIDGSPTTCSPGQLATSGWYDDDDGNERNGLMGARKGRRSFDCLRGLWRSCFGRA